MLKKMFFISLLLIFLTPVLTLAHGDEKHKEKVAKVSTMIQEEDEHVHSDSLKEVEEKKSIEKDFMEIREDVEKSTVPTVIKAISLAAIIAGLLFIYLPKKNEEDSNE